MRYGRYSRDARLFAAACMLLYAAVLGACYLAYWVCRAVAVLLRAVGVHIYSMGKLFWGMLIGLRGRQAVAAAPASDRAGVTAGLALRTAFATAGSRISEVGAALLSLIIAAGLRVDLIIRSLAGNDMFLVWLVRWFLVLAMICLQGFVFYHLDRWLMPVAATAKPASAAVSATDGGPT
jgi:hypothetical protein